MSSVERRNSIAIIGYAVLALIVARSSFGVVVRGLVATPLVLLLPGYSVLRIAIGVRRLDFETLVLSIALSMAIDIFGGLFLNVFDALSLDGWTLLLGLVTVSALTLSLFAVSAPAKTAPRSASLRLRPAQWAMCAAAVLIGACAIGLARSGAESQHEYTFTEFWMVPKTPSGGNIVTVGIKNQEKIASTYSIALFADGANVSRRSGIALQPGESWSDVVPLNGPLLRAQRVEAWLFKDDQPDNVYRKVWLSNPVNSVTPSKEQG